MSSQARTYHSRVESKLSEHAPPPKHTWWLAIHTDKGWLPRIGDGFLGLQFKDNVTQEEAQAFEKMFDKMVAGVSYTEFL
jgi:hypothetical protein